MRRNKTRITLSLLLALCLVLSMGSMAYAGKAGQVAQGNDGGFIGIAPAGAFIEADDSTEGECTSVYFGKDTTDSGAYFYGRTEDYSYSWRKIMFVEPAATHEPGEMFVTNEAGGAFRWPYPEQTLRYQTCPDSYYNERNGRTAYGEIAMNEAGVVVSATVTLNSPRSQITSASGGNDAMIRNDGGLMEIDTPDLILMKATTAREGIEILAEICDVRGASGCEGTQVGDANEVWYFQVLSGHQYVGVKCPPDMLGLSPNMTANVGFNGFGGYNGYLDVTDTENVIASPGLIATAQKAGTFVGDPADPDPANPTRIRIQESYVSNTPNHTTNARLRNGFGYLFGLTTQAQINALFPVASKPVDYFFNPPADKKYSLYEAMRMLGDTGQGTAWAVAGTSNGQSIGNENTQEAHIIELRPWMPDELATIQWIAMGPAEFSIYLPMFGNLVTDVFEKCYISDHQSYIQADPYANSFWHTFRGLHNLATRGTVTASSTTVTTANKNKYGASVKAFWERYQLELIAQQAYIDEMLTLVLEEEGRDFLDDWATNITKAIQEEAYDYAQALSAELKAYVAAGAVGNFNTVLLDDPDAIPVYAGLITAEVIDPTCTEDGYTAYTCKGSEKVYVCDVVPALGHDFVPVSAGATSTNLQNCITATVTVYGVCANCGEPMSIDASVTLKQNWTQVFNVGGYDVTVVVNNNKEITDVYLGKPDVGGNNGNNGYNGNNGNEGNNGNGNGNNNGNNGNGNGNNGNNGNGNNGNDNGNNGNNGNGNNGNGNGNNGNNGNGNGNNGNNNGNGNGNNGNGNGNGNNK